MEIDHVHYGNDEDIEDDDEMGEFDDDMDDDNGIMEFEYTSSMDEDQEEDNLEESDE